MASSGGISHSSAPAYTPPPDEAPIGTAGAPAGASVEANGDSSAEPTPAASPTPAPAVFVRGGTPSAPGVSTPSGAPPPTLAGLSHNLDTIDSSKLDLEQSKTEISNQSTRFGNLAQQIATQTAAVNQLKGNLATLLSKQQDLQSRYNGADDDGKKKLQGQLDQATAAVLSTEATISHVSANIDRIASEQSTVQQFTQQLFKHALERMRDDSNDQRKADNGQATTGGAGSTAAPAQGSGGGTGTLSVNGAPIPAALQTVAAQMRAAGMELTGGDSDKDSGGVSVNVNT